MHLKAGEEPNVVACVKKKINGKVLCALTERRVWFQVYNIFVNLINDNKRK